MTLWLWAGFVALIFVIVLIDLTVINRKARIISAYEALAWTAFWIAIALAFNAGIYFLYEYHVFGIGLGGDHPLDGQQAALQFFTGYLIEKSLSIDNIFVIALIFGYFRIPLEYQYRVLYWGVLGAVVLRGLMIAGGLALFYAFDWIIYVFGAFLIYISVKMLATQHGGPQPEKNPLINFVQHRFPVSTELDDDHFFTRIDGRRAVTPLLLALLMVESADVMFAVDSIPAIIAVTRDPFLVFTSNIFAVLGLRSLYFALAGIMQKLRFFKISLAFLLGFIGTKMLLAHIHPIPTSTSLIVIASILAAGSLASVFARETEALLTPLADELERLTTLTYKGMRRIVVLATGTTTIVVGIIMIFTPGPALLVIPAGLAILATEFLWARHLLKRFKEEFGQALKKIGKKQARPPDDNDGAAYNTDSKPSNRGGPR